MPCAVHCKPHCFGLLKIPCWQWAVPGPGATSKHLGMLLNTPSIQNAQGEHTWSSVLHCRWHYPRSARSQHQRCDRGNFNGLIIAERQIHVCRNVCGFWVYWNGCSAAELGFLTVYTEGSFRKLSIYDMRKNVFTWVSLFLNHSNYQLWWLMPGIKVRWSIMSNGSIC